MVSSVTAPLLNEDGRVIAVLNSENTEAGHFDEDDLSYTTSLSHVAAAYVTKLRSRRFFDRVLSIVADKTAGANELLRRVVEVIKDYVGYTGMIMAIKRADGGIAMVRCDGFTVREEELIIKALRGELQDADPLIAQALRNGREYHWNRGDEDQAHRPWFPSLRMKEQVKSENVFLLKLSSGEPMGGFSLELAIEHAIDSFQEHSIRQVLPVIARLLWDVETHLALKQEVEVLKVEAAFSTALRQIAHNLNHISFQIGGLAYSLEELEELSEEGHRVVDEIIMNASELGSLENNIRCLSRPPQPQPVRVLDCWRIVEETLTQKLRHLNIDVILRIPEDCRVWCDPLVLQTALGNLVDNSIQAIQHARIETARILLDCRDDVDHAQLVIEDNGTGFVGISPEQAMEWFSTTHSSGTGIGLPFSKELLRRCSGNLRIVAPRELTGAAVEITLRKEPKQESGNETPCS